MIDGFRPRVVRVVPSCGGSSDSNRAVVSRLDVVPRLQGGTLGAAALHQRGADELVRPVGLRSKGREKGHSTVEDVGETYNCFLCCLVCLLFRFLEPPEAGEGGPNRCHGKA